MWKYTVRVTGMMCGMCESHVNDAVRRAFPVKKVTSSRSKKETTVIAETELDEAALREAIRALTVQGLLEVQRGRGTFVSRQVAEIEDFGFGRLEEIRDTDQQREEADGCWQRFWRTVETGRR